MPDPEAFELLHDLASLQRRQSGGFILLAADRSRACMVEPYAEKKPRGTQILGMTSKGWGLIPRV
jgi:hypothetical protein